MKTLRRPQSRRRTGTIFIAVLITATIVSLLGLSALSLRRITRRTTESGSDISEARLLAQSAVRLAMLRIENDPDWRYNYPNGDWESNIALGNGTLTVSGIDPADSDLTDAPGEPLELTGTGRRGVAVQKVKVILAPQNRAYSCLDVGLLAGNDITFTDASVQTAVVMAANNSVSESGTSSINPDIEAVTSITGDDYSGTTTTGVATRLLPPTLQALDYYKRVGTWIDIDDIITADPPPPPPPLQAPNLLTNSGIESGLSPWYAQSPAADVATTTAQVYSGTTALLLENRTEANDGARQDVDSFLQHATTYDLSAWVRTVSGTADVKLSIGIEAYGVIQWVSNGTTSVGTTWTKVTTSLTPEWYFTPDKIFLSVGTESSLVDLYIDDVYLGDPAQAPTPPGEELLVKGDMESDPLTDWYGISITPFVTATAHGGVQALDSGTHYGTDQVIAQDVTANLENGAEYHAEAWLQPPFMNANVKLALKIDSTGEGLRTIDLTPLTAATSGAFTKVYGQTTISWTGTLTKAEFIAWTDDVYNALILDDAKFIKTSVSPPPPRTIYRSVLSPSSNPFGTGTLNAQGTYVVDCENNDIHIQESRLAATLVLLNVGPGSSIREGAVNWSAAVANFPALMVDGDFEINSTNGGLSEAILDANFNPTGTPMPFAGSDQDGDKTDTWLSQVDGLIFVTGDLSFSNHPVVHGGVTVGGDVSVTDTLELSDWTTFRQNPPPGFSGPEEIRILLNSAERAFD